MDICSVLNPALIDHVSGAQKLSESEKFIGGETPAEPAEELATYTRYLKIKKKLSDFLSAEEMLNINTGVQTISKKLEEDLRTVCKALKSRSRKNSINTSKLSAMALSMSEEQSKYFPLYHIYNDIYSDSLITPTISFSIQSELVKKCVEGTIQVDYNLFLKHMMNILNLGESETQQILLSAADNNIILISSRQITQYHKLNFVSLKVHILSLQNLIWVVKSLKIDRVTPIQNVVLSRIKQSFGLSFKSKLWRSILKQFYDLCSNDIESFKVILIGTISCVPTDQLPKEIIKSALDDFENGLIVNNAENPFVKGQNANILDIENMKEIDAEDIQPIEEDNEGLWTKFCQYINELFEDELIFFNNTIKENQERRKPLNPILDLPFYKTKSGDHTITQGSYYKGGSNADSQSKTQHFNVLQSNDNSKLQTSQKSKEQSNTLMSTLGVLEHQGGKAIPGGRHGLTQFIKNFGPDFLRKLSYGKLSKLVQTSIDKGHIKYFKTFLVKNTEQSGIIERKKNTSSENLNKELKLKKIHDGILESLIENSNYLPLAQLKKLLNKKLDFSINLDELGFAKLRNLVVYFEDVKLESLGNNHFYLSLDNEKFAELKANLPKNEEEPKEKSYKPILADLSKDSISLKNMYNFPQVPHIPNIPLAQNHPQNFNYSSYSLRNINKKQQKGQQSLHRSSQNLKPLFNESHSIKRNIQNNHSWNGNSLDMLRPMQKGHSLGADQSHFQAFLRNIIKTISQILNENTYGIDLGVLYQKLIQRLGVDSFNPRTFGCENFYTFLINFAENKVDIEMCRNQQNGMICLIIYPKNYRFGIRSTIRNKQMKKHSKFHEQAQSDLPRPSATQKLSGSHQNFDNLRSSGEVGNYGLGAHKGNSLRKTISGPMLGGPIPKSSKLKDRNLKLSSEPFTQSDFFNQMNQGHQFPTQSPTQNGIPTAVKNPQQKNMLNIGNISIFNSNTRKFDQHYQNQPSSNKKGPNS